MFTFYLFCLFLSLCRLPWLFTSANKASFHFLVLFWHPFSLFDFHCWFWVCVCVCVFSGTFTRERVAYERRNRGFFCISICDYKEDGIEWQYPFFCFVFLVPFFYKQSVRAYRYTDMGYPFPYCLSKGIWNGKVPPLSQWNLSCLNQIQGGSLVSIFFGINNLTMKESNYGIWTLCYATTFKSNYWRLTPFTI